jgi:hypothetical protein
MNIREAAAKIFRRPFLDELILGRDTRVCERCSAPTMWRRSRQRTKGYCGHHAIAEQITVQSAIQNVMESLPVARVDVDWEPDRSFRGPHAEAGFGPLGYQRPTLLAPG